MDIHLRAWRPEDAPALSHLLNNKNILDNLRDGPPYPYTPNDAKDYIEAMLQADPDTTFAWAITTDDQPIGSIGIFRKDNIHRRTAELGYYVAEPYWGKGAGTTAVKKACDLVFANTDILRIFAEPFSVNAASCRILEKAGFVFEGPLRKNALKNGVILDMKMYALIKP